MSRLVVLAVSGMLVSFAPAAPAMAHDGLQHLCHDARNNPINDINQCCYDPSTGGPTNVEGFPYCPSYLDRISGGEQYGTIDRTALAHTHVCAPGVDCGPPVELSNVKPFYGSTGTPAPIAAVPAPAPTSVIMASVQEVVAVAPVTAAPAVYAPVPFSSAGLGGGALAFGAVTAVGLAAIIALAANDSSSTNNTQ